MIPDTDRKRWIGFGVLSLGTLMIVLDTTIVNVALPSVKSDLGFSEAGLAWVINAYMLTFGGFLLLGGRLGDFYGQRKLFLLGLALFTSASLACGLATSQAGLVAARAIQGFGGAVTSAVSLSLMMNLFQDTASRAKAMGFYGFIAAGGGSIGVLAGGLLTSALNWHWVFLVNIPIGVGVVAASLAILPAGKAERTGKLDVGGAASITAALLLAVYAVINGNEAGWTSARTLGLLGASLVLVAAFVAIERRTPQPLVPLGLFRLPNLRAANVVGVLWAAAMFAWFFLSALYMQLVLGYSPLQVGLGFLTANIIMAVFSVGISAKLVMRFGLRAPMAVGLGLAALGLLTFARAPVEGAFLLDVLPGMVLLGFGAGMAFNPVLLAAMGDVAPQDSGLASGIVNTSFMMGGSLGLAVLASLAAARTHSLAGGGASSLVALNGGYHAAFLLGAVFAGAAAVTGAAFIRPLPAGSLDAHGMPAPPRPRPSAGSEEP